MKATLTILLIFAATMCNAQTTPSTPTVDSNKILYEGTIVTVKLLKDISSKSANEGDVVEFETSEPVINGSYVLIPAGVKVYGKVTESEKKKMLGKAGKLNFTIDYLTLPNGRTIKLEGEQKGKGKNKGGAAVAEAVLLTPLFLLKKGKNVHFDKGQIFKAFVEKEYQL